MRSTRTDELPGAGNCSPELREAADGAGQGRRSEAPKIARKLRRVRVDKVKLREETRGAEVNDAHRICPQTAADCDDGELRLVQPGGVFGVLLLGRRWRGSRR